MKILASLFATSGQDSPQSSDDSLLCSHPFSFRLDAQVTSVNCSADSQALLSNDAAGNDVWLVAGPESILGGEQLDLTCTVFYSFDDLGYVPSFTNVSLEGQDHCYTYVEPPTFGPGPTAGPTGTFGPGPTAGPTGTIAPGPTAVPTGTIAPGSTAGPNMGTFGPGPTSGPTGTFAPETTTLLDYCCGSWGSYLTEDDQNAGKATSVLSVIACADYTDGVEIALR